MMKTKNNWLRCTGMICLMVVLFAGCRSASIPVTFYTLSSVRTMDAEMAKPFAEQPDISIGVGPAQLPDYLDRPQIITRTGPNSLSLSEFNRWGGNLNQNFLETFAEDLSVLLSTHRVLVYPWEGLANPDYIITLDVHQFEGRLGDSFVLDVTWTLKKTKDQKTPLYIARSVISRPVSGQDYAALVSVSSETVAALSREVSKKIIQMAKEAPAETQ